MTSAGFIKGIADDAAAGIQRRRRPGRRRRRRGVYLYSDDTVE